MGEEVPLNRNHRSLLTMMVTLGAALAATPSGTAARVSIPPPSTTLVDSPFRRAPENPGQSRDVKRLMDRERRRHDRDARTYYKKAKR